jgi:hypothetical protein
MDPVVVALVCPNCKKSVNVRVQPDVPKHTFHCPGCKAIVSTQS